MLKKPQPLVSLNDCIMDHSVISVCIQVFPIASPIASSQDQSIYQIG